jgi:FAD-dependent oxidoreductase domain-containing protein 1
LAGIGVEQEDDENELPEESFKTVLPVERRKRYIYLVQSENGPILNTPLTIDHTGVFFRRYGLGNHYICGLNQDEVR